MATTAATRLRLALCNYSSPTLLRRPTASACLAARRYAAGLHTNSAKAAKVVPVYGTGPPPEPPKPSPEFASEEYDPFQRVERRRKQAESLRLASDPRADAAAANASRRTSSTGGSTLKRRFWKDVHVVEKDDAYEVHLDKRPLRRPDTKAIIRLPLSKPHLAHALAIEWDQLVSAQQATKQHLIPLTSLVCRALDIADEDAKAAASGTPDNKPIRASIATVLLRYLDTDSLLCWAPAADPSDPASPSNAVNGEGRTLRDLQEEDAMPIVSFLTSRVWPGVAIEPVLDTESIVPKSQPAGTREVVHGWILGLSGWELAGLERATLAGKSLLAAARLVVEWSEDKAGAVVEERSEGQKAFGVEEAALVVSQELNWQIQRWGEVEDTHDVEREDIRRQFGSVVLLVSGNGQGQAQDASSLKAKI